MRINFTGTLLVVGIIFVVIIAVILIIVIVLKMRTNTESDVKSSGSSDLNLNPPLKMYPTDSRWGVMKCEKINLKIYSI